MGEDSALTERLAAAGKTDSVSLEATDLEVEEELSTMATLAWAEGVWLGKWEKNSTWPGGGRVLRC